MRATLCSPRSASRRRRATAWAGAVLASVVAGACANTSGRLAYGADELRAEINRRAPDLPDELIVIPFEVTPSQVALAHRMTQTYPARNDQARALIHAMFDPAAFGLRYTSTVTATADDTLRSREGNCLSLASVYVGLARALGLKAHYLDASSRVSDLSNRDSGLVVNSGHITAVVEVDGYRWYLDFDRSIGPIQSYRMLDDTEALAHFYNNRGYERIEVARIAGRDVDWSLAAADFIIATRVAPKFTRAWNNLGLANARLGFVADAETAYREAIATGPSLSAPYNNLGALYMSTGRAAKAVPLLKRAVALEPDAAHAHYNLGRALLATGERAAAVTALERASKLRSQGATALLDKMARYQATRDAQ